MARMTKRPWKPPWKDRIESWGVPGMSFVCKFSMLFVKLNFWQDVCLKISSISILIIIMLVLTLLPTKKCFSPCRSPSPPARIPFHPWASAFRDPVQIHFRNIVIIPLWTTWACSCIWSASSWKRSHWSSCRTSSCESDTRLSTSPQSFNIWLSEY